MIELVTLGRATIRRDGEELAGLTARNQEFALLVYVALEGQVSRDRLISIFWPERDEEAARQGLAQALATLKRELGEGRLVVEGDFVALAGETCTVDARQLEDAARAENWERVAELYSGPFLAGFELPGAPAFEEWRSGTGDRLAGLARRGGVEEGAADVPAQPGGWPVFLKRLRDRLIFQVGLVYLGAAWLALQVADILVERGLVADWTFKVVLYVLAAGLPIALTLAWAQEQQADKAFWPAWARRVRPGYVLAALLTLVLVLLPGYLLLVRRLPVPSPEIDAAAALDPTSIAVLYLDDYSEGAQLKYLAESLTEHLIDQLAQVGALSVVSRNAVKPYRQLDVPLDSVAQILGVGTLVEGSVTGARDSVRVSVQLIDANTLIHLESRTVDGSAEDPFALFDRVDAEIVRLLRQRLGLEIRLREMRAGTLSQVAWEQTQRALSLLEEFVERIGVGDTVGAAQTLGQADRLLERAESEDPSWIEPVLARAEAARLGAIHLRPADRQYDTTWVHVGIAHSERALDLAARDARALEHQGILLSYLASMREGPESDSLMDVAAEVLRAAVDLDATRARAWSRLSRILQSRAQFREALWAAERAYAADAFLEEARVILFRLCQNSLELKDWDAVTRWCGEGRRRFPDRASFVSAQLSALAGPEGPEPDGRAAWALGEKLLELSPPQRRAERRPRVLMEVAAVLAREGLADSALAVIAQGRALLEGADAETDYYEANARLRLGQTDAALDLLEAYLRAEPGERGYIARDWWWESLHTDPRFQSLVADDAG